MINQYKEIANKINTFTDVNIFENTRRRNVVEARAVFTYILRNYFNLGLTRIANVYKSQGKDMNHATVLHSINNWEVYVFNEPKLADIVLQVMNDTDNADTKVKRDWIKSKVQFLTTQQVNEVQNIIDKKITDNCLVY